MILTFSRDSFKEDIIAGTKITTIRLDPKKRWKAGMKIQFWRGSPRNPKSGPYCFATGKCVHVEKICIDPEDNEITIFSETPFISTYKNSDSKTLDTIAIMDGFKDWNEMKQWFSKPFTGRYIYFVVESVVDQVISDDKN